MERYGGSSDARNFTKILSERGYLNQFQEMGKIDIGIVFFPDRANTNEAYYLLNGSPVLVSTEISQKEEQKLMSEIKQDLLYSEMKEKYSNIWFLGFFPKFINSSKRKFYQITMKNLYLSISLLMVVVFAIPNMLSRLDLISIQTVNS